MDTYMYYDYSTCNLYPCVSPFKDTCSVTYKMLPGSIITNEIPTNLTDVDIIFDV